MVTMQVQVNYQTQILHGDGLQQLMKTVLKPVDAYTLPNGRTDSISRCR